MLRRPSEESEMWVGGLGSESEWGVFVFVTEWRGEL